MLKSKFSWLQRCRWQCGSIFIRLAVVASQICEIPRNYPKIQSHTMSSILVSIANCLTLLAGEAGEPIRIYG